MDRETSGNDPTTEAGQQSPARSSLLTPGKKRRPQSSPNVRWKDGDSPGSRASTPVTLFEGSSSSSVPSSVESDLKVPLLGPLPTPCVEGDDGFVPMPLSTGRNKVLSDAGALINFLKAFLGTGIMALPWAVMEGGLFPSIASIVTLSLLANYSLKSLVWCKLDLQARGIRKQTYGGVGKVLFGNIGARTAHIAVSLSQLGFCCSYFIFTSQNLNSVFPQIDSYIFVGIVFLPITCLSLLPNLDKLTYSSLFGVFFVFIVVALVFYYGFDDFNPDSSDMTHFDMSTFPLFFTTTVFAFEGQTMALPIHGQMKDPKNFFRIVDILFAVVVVIFASFGSFGYLFFNEKTCSMVTMNLPTNTLTSIVKISLCVVLIASYPVQLFPVTQAIENRLRRVAPDMLHPTVVFPYRIFIIIVTAAVAIAVPNFGLFLSVMGALTNSMVSFILPALFSMKCFKGRLSPMHLAINLIVLFVGLAGMFVGGYYSLSSLITALVEGTPSDDCTG